MDPTQQTYNKSAQKFSDFFATFGSRQHEIDFARRSTQKQVPLTVLELGCGDGRDAKDIFSFTQDYTGLDYSKGLINIAKQNYPEHSELFAVGDMKTFEMNPEQYDLIFAFASFLHLSKEELGPILQKYSLSLRSGGVLCMSFKAADSYERRVQVDTFGERIFYFYNSTEILNMMPQDMSLLHQSNYKKGSTNWFTLTFRNGGTHAK
ncbi:MAG: class I SAM-dependent methyltransferase [Candidatus Saccharimonadales bacterium]